MKVARSCWRPRRVPKRWNRCESEVTGAGPNVVRKSARSEREVSENDAEEKDRRTIIEHGAAEKVGR